MQKKYPDPLLTKRWEIDVLGGKYIFYHNGDARSAKFRGEEIVGCKIKAISPAPWSEEKVEIFDGRAAPGA